jgi:broad specificity phosphatase PhoE
MRALYLTHPQVRIDPDMPVPHWGLSEIGRARAGAFVASGAVPPGAAVFSSAETKALELAGLIAGAAGTAIITDALMGENDRSATGFLPPDRFEAMADRFFARPEDSIEGWERAIDAQARIVAAVGAALRNLPAEVPTIFCGHGAVGTLLKCHIGQRAISRAEDQMPGGGNGFVFDFARRQLFGDWTPFEAIGIDWAA